MPCDVMMSPSAEDLKTPKIWKWFVILEHPHNSSLRMWPCDSTLQYHLPTIVVQLVPISLAIVCALQSDLRRQAIK